MIAMMTDDEEVIEQVLELDGKGSPSPWQTSGVRIQIDGERYLTIGSDEEYWALVPYGDGSNEHHVRAHADQKIIAEYRTDAPDLARRLRERNARIAVLEKQLGEADAALVEVGHAITNKMAATTVWAWRAALSRRTRKGDHRG